MERIQALINKLKEQFEQQVAPGELLETVQELHQQLLVINKPVPRTLGTSKVSVMMPANISPEIYQRYAPQPAAEEPSQKEEKLKETVLVDEGKLSIVQEDGQLDMVFDPLVEIPTLSQQLSATQSDSLNDKLRQGKTELIEFLKDSPVKDLRKAIGINERFSFINDLFRGDEAMYERSIKTINGFNIFAEAEYWITRELKTKLGWNPESETVTHFDKLVKRRFS